MADPLRDAAQALLTAWDAVQALDPPMTHTEADSLTRAEDAGNDAAEALRAALAAADGTTPTQPDEVLWEGETVAPEPTWIASYLPPVTVLSCPPGTRVRVVVTPATEQT